MDNMKYDSRSTHVLWVWDSTGAIVVGWEAGTRYDVKMRFLAYRARGLLPVGSRWRCDRIGPHRNRIGKLRQI